MINTEIDVLDQIKPLLQFNSDDDFYPLFKTLFFR